MWSSGRALVVVAGLFALAPTGSLFAQGEDTPRYVISPSGQLSELFEPESAGFQSALEQVPSPGRASVSSAILPGLGQRLLGLDRWAAYMAAEAWAWVQYFERRSEGQDLQTSYRDLAWLVARRVSSGPRVDGSFEYYESLTKFNSSGAYDSDSNQRGIQPEENSDTYNGSIWELSRQIYGLDDPEVPLEVDSEPYQEALGYYGSRAYTPDLAWNWSTNTLQQAEYAGLIKSSDDNLRRSTTMVGVILANHLLSAVDALVSARLGEVESRPPTLSLSLVPGPFYRDSFLLAVSFPFD
jgi:hypothetical protein